MDAVARHADDRVAGTDSGAGDGRCAVLQHAHARCRDIECVALARPGERIGVLRQFAADDGDTGALCRVAHALAECGEHLRVGALERDVVHEGDGPRACADDVVHVDGHAVPADRFEVAGELGEDTLGADAVG